MAKTILKQIIILLRRSKRPKSNCDQIIGGKSEFWDGSASIMPSSRLLWGYMIEFFLCKDQRSFRYARVRDVDEMFLPSVAVFITELLKIAICISMVMYEEGPSQWVTVSSSIDLLIPSQVPANPASVHNSAALGHTQGLPRYCSKINSLGGLVKYWRKICFILEESIIFQVCVPAMLYVVQNTLFYIAASHLEAAVFAVWNQQYPKLP